MKRTAFSLVELSIVLVILGLLVGGILAGQSLIHAAELRTIGAEYTRYRTATAAFKDKYFGLPGDITNATAFWGKDNANCSTDSGTAATNGTCNGNGNGSFDVVVTTNATVEAFQFWRQLNLAGLMEGPILSGLSGPVNTNCWSGQAEDHTTSNAPPSRVFGAMWGVTGHWNNWWYNNLTGNKFTVGKRDSGCLPNIAIITPEDAWNIDTKTDDGKPGTGIVNIAYWSPAPGAPGGVRCATPGTSGATYATDEYNLSVNSIACTLFFSRLY